MGLGDWKNHAVFLEKVIPLPVLRLPEFLLGVTMGLRFLRDQNGQDQTAWGQTSRPLRVYPAVFATLAALSLSLGNWVSIVILPFAGARL
jgi:hypothetical protein